MKRIAGRGFILAMILAVIFSATISLAARSAENQSYAERRPTTLSIEHSGPDAAGIRSDVTYQIVVRNTGTSTAENVVLRDRVPDGFIGQPITLNLGDIAPGQSKSAKVTFKATKRGKLCNTVTAIANNAAPVNNDACTTILAPGLKVEKSGTKEEIIGREAIYEVVVSNSGDTTLHNVVVTDTAAAGTAITSASKAASSGKRAIWTIPSLAVGAKQSFTVKMNSNVAGNHCNRVTAKADGLSDSAEVCTIWKSSGAVQLDIAAQRDRIRVGEETSYTIKVSNQGLARIHGVKIVGKYDDKVSPTASAAGRIRGQTVEFPAIVTLEPRQVITYTITIKGAKAGDSRNQFTLTCDELTSPVEEIESTTVY
jgi:uncharacterized repeat protein (TIGR01451 family)